MVTLKQELNLIPEHQKINVDNFLECNRLFSGSVNEAKEKVFKNELPDLQVFNVSVNKLDFSLTIDIA